MRFWDTSAIVPLLVPELTSSEMHRLTELDPDILVWWASEVECASAVLRRERSGILDGQQITTALSRLTTFAAGWTEIEPGRRVKNIATRFLRVHSLRAADALQLAAAFVGAGDQPESLPFVTLDTRLAEAAALEGFQIVGA